MRTVRLVVTGLAGLIAVFGGALVFGAQWAWELAFGLAYCLDGYGGCPWQ